MASHGLEWIDYKDASAEKERADIAEAIRLHTEIVGERPLGFYQGPHVRKHHSADDQEGGFLYSADVYADELPYWHDDGRRQQLLIPLYARRQRHAFRHAAASMRATSSSLI